MLRRERPHTIECESKLHVHRLFDPQGAIIVKNRYTILLGDKVGTAPVSDLGHEAGNCPLGIAVVP
jgi:hypothetical protein